MPIAEPGAATPDNSRDALWHLGGLLRIRAYGAATDGALAILEEHARRGYRTPAHVHTREDETLYVLSTANCPIAAATRQAARDPVMSCSCPDIRPITSRQPGHRSLTDAVPA